MTKLNLKKYKSTLTKAVIVILILIPVAIGGFWGYTRFASYSPEANYLELAQNDQDVKITKYWRYYKISPKNLETDQTAIIYYTGGLVHPESYLFQIVQMAKSLQTDIYLSRPV